MDSFSVIMRYSRIFLEKKLKEYNINFNEQIILMYISNNEYTNQDKIAKNFMIDKGTITRSINKLEEKGFLHRKENPNNKRENLIVLSQKGKKVTRHMNNLHIEWQSIIFKDFSEIEIKQVKNQKEKIIANIINAMNNED